MLKYLNGLIILFAATNLFAQLSSGNALYLDGNGDFVRLLENIITTETFTIEAYANMFDRGGGTVHQNPIFTQRNELVQEGSSTVVLLAADHIGLAGIFIRSSIGTYDYVQYKFSPFGEWHHYAGVVAPEKILLYIDGELVSQVTNTQTGDYKTSIDFVEIGRHSYDPHRERTSFFNGIIDELRIWNHPRSIQQIRETKIDTLGPEYYQNPASGLAGYWRFDTVKNFDIGGNTVKGVRDWSTKAHHGIFEGDAKLVSPQPTIHTLLPFNLLEPANDATINTTSPTLIWQQPTNMDVFWPGEIRYRVYYDNNPDFNTAKIVKVNNDTSITISDLTAGTTYFCKVLAKNIAGDSLLSSNTNGFFVRHCATGVEAYQQNLPNQFVLHQNYPNPFNPTTTIQYNLRRSEMVTLKICNIAGQVVRVLVNEHQPAESFSVVWDAQDEAAGIYIVELATESFRQVRKMTLVK